MPEQSKADMVMKFVRSGGGRVNAECALGKDPADPFMKDFSPASYTSYSNFFEVTKFDFGVEVKDDDTAVGTLSKTTPAGAAPTTKAAASAKAKGGFVSWRSATEDQLKKIDYPVEFDTFSFTRLIDSASPVFFQACCATNSFDSATLVKRVSIGADKPATGFLRLDFKEVLITGIDWDDGEVLNETCKFICKAFSLQYRRQNPDGTLQAAVSASWDQVRDARRNGSP